MGTALIVIGLLGFLTCIVFLIVRAIKRQGKLRLCALALGGFFVLVIIGGVVSGSYNSSAPTGSIPVSTKRPTPTPTESPEDYKKLARSDITYSELLRNTENYVGWRVTYTGKVIQVMEKSSGAQGASKMDMRIEITRGDYGIWNDAVFVHFTGPRILQGDIVKFWGSVDGRLSYKAVLGNQITIPEVTAKYLEVIEARK